jgi:septum formation protein
MNKVNPSLVLASSSSIRAKILNASGLAPIVVAPCVDEDLIIQSLLAENIPVRDIADALAEAKARKISQQYPQAIVLGCDQTLDLNGRLLQKPFSQSHAIDQLSQMQGQLHHLYSAAVIYEQGQPIWRHIGHARMTMRHLSSETISTYVAQNWPSIQHSVGCFKIEEAGVQLFSDIQGDTFTIQGIPLIPILNFLSLKG